MSAFIDCLTRNLGDSLPQSKKAILARYDKMVDAMRKEGADDLTAQGMAEKALIEEAEFQLQSKMKIVIKSAEKQKQLFDAIENYRNASGKKDPAEALMRMIENPNNQYKGASFFSREDTVKGQLFSNMTDFTRKYSTTFGKMVDDPAKRKANELAEIVSELHGIKTGNRGAESMAAGIADTFEQARLRANKAGANIPKRENFGLPHNHNKVAIKKMGEQAWIKLIEPKIDWAKMKDFETGGRILDKDAFLADSYKTIITNGTVKLTPGEFKGKGAMATRMHQQRVFEFTNDKDWLDYHKAAGEGTVFDLIVNHVSQMSRDIAMMEVFGPNPTAMKTALEDKAKKIAADIDIGTEGKKSKAGVKAQKRVDKFSAMWHIMTGANGIIEGDAIGEFPSSVRSIMSANFLGATALLAAPTDGMTSRLARLNSGLPLMGMTRKYLKQLNPLSSKDRELAERMGIVNELAINSTMATERIFGEMSGHEFAQQYTDTMMRINGLSVHTQAARNVHGIEWVNHLTTKAQTNFNELDGAFKKTLDNYGIDESDWKFMQKQPKQDIKGGQFIVPNAMRGTDKGDLVSDKLMDMINTEIQFAVPSASLEASATFIGTSKPGTYYGELLRSGAQFKNFPATMYFLFGRKAMMQTTLKGRIGVAASFVVPMAMAGALATQVREMAKGRDPMNMDATSQDGLKFWGKALLASGGLGIFGDFLFSNLNSYGGGLGQTLSGPTAGLATDTLDLTFGNIKQAVQGDDTGVAMEIADYSYRYLAPKPFFLRLAIERIVVDELQKQIDPKAHAKFRRRQKMFKRDYGQEYWWKPGDTKPDRLPEYTQ